LLNLNNLLSSTYPNNI